MGAVGFGALNRWRLHLILEAMPVIILPLFNLTDICTILYFYTQDWIEEKWVDNFERESDIKW